MPVAQTFEQDAQAALKRHQAHMRTVHAAERSDHHALACAERQDHQRSIARAHALAPFDPPPHIASQILQDILSTAALEEVAERANTSLEQLCLWMDNPDIARRLSAMQRAMARKLTICTLHHSGAFLASLGHIFENFNEFESFVSLSGSDQERKAHLRNRESLIKAGKAMLATAKFLTTTAPPPSPAPAGEVSERSEDGGGMPPSPPASIPRSQDPSIPSTPAHRYPAKARTPEPFPNPTPPAHAPPPQGEVPPLWAAEGALSPPRLLLLPPTASALLHLHIPPDLRAPGARPELFPQVRQHITRPSPPPRVGPRSHTFPRAQRHPRAHSPTLCPPHYSPPLHVVQ